MMKSSVKIIVENGGILTITRDGKMDTIPNTAYNKMKIGDFHNNRIFHDFTDDTKIVKKVLETFDDGIFNCTIGDEEPIQLRDGEKVARAILDHKKTGSVALLKKLYLNEMGETFSEKAIGEFLEPHITSGRVKQNVSGYLIDERFIVTPHAQAQHYFKDEWRNICIVVQNEINPFDISTPFGDVEITSKAVEVLTKIIFLLKPNTGDDVFMSQLTADLQEELRRDFPPPPPACKRISDLKDEEGFPEICKGAMETHDAQSGLLVCSLCMKASEADQHKYETEQLALAGLDKNATTLDIFGYENDN